MPLDLPHDENGVSGLLEVLPRPLTAANPPPLMDQEDVPGTDRAAQLDPDLGAPADHLGEHAADVLAAVDRGGVGRDQAAVAGEAGGRGIEITRVQSLRELRADQC